MLEYPYIINKTTTENAPKAGKGVGNMCESEASFLSVHHNPEEDLHRKKHAADSNGDISQC